MASEMQQTFDWNSVQASENDDRSFLNFDKENTPLVMKFEENDPCWTGVPVGDKFQRTKWMFKVEAGNYEKMIFSVSSKVLMRELAKIRPLKGKTVEIVRAGQGFDTQYTVKVL